MAAEAVAVTAKAKNTAVLAVFLCALNKAQGLGVA
jgi:hypothetical protein